jgi:NAD(P)-dependent dehydrogenase (short-subunit alcohol dehydrogenase family)
MKAGTVLVTGANRGIGLEFVRQYLERNFRVLAACRTPRAAKHLAELKQSRPDALEVLPLEVTDEQSVTTLAQSLAGKAIDVLINNAGILGGDQQTLESMNYAAWKETFAVNAIAPFRLTVSLLPNLKLSRRPRVITLSSQMGSLQRTTSGYYAYQSSKAALNKVMQGLAVDLRSAGIIVCPVHPGWVQTDMGGAGATLTVEQSVGGLIRVIDRLTASDSGRFFQWDGSEHPW